MIELDILQSDSIAELFDEITLLTLYDAWDTVNACVTGIEYREEMGEDIADYELVDYADSVEYRNAIHLVIKYMTPASL